MAVVETASGNPDAAPCIHRDGGASCWRLALARTPKGPPPFSVAKSSGYEDGAKRCTPIHHGRDVWSQTHRVCPSRWRGPPFLSNPLPCHVALLAVPLAPKLTFLKLPPPLWIPRTPRGGAQIIDTTQHLTSVVPATLSASFTSDGSTAGCRDGKPLLLGLPTERLSSRYLPYDAHDHFASSRVISVRDDSSYRCLDTADIFF